MRLKKYLPLLITAILTILLLIYAVFSTNLHLASTPFNFMENMGIYSDGAGNYGIMNKDINASGTTELFVSFLKLIASENAINGIVPFAILGILLTVALVYAMQSSNKTKYEWTSYLCAVLLPFVFCDFVNIVYFKTLYSQPLILTLLIIICAIFIGMFKKENVSISKLIVLFAATILYSRTGAVQAVTSIILGILIVRLYSFSVKNITKILSVALGVIVIIQSIIFTISYKPVDYKQNLYNSVFYGVCKYDSVTELGLDSKLDDFKEVYYGMMENEAEYDLETTFYNKISYASVIKYYATHPINLIKLLNDESKAAFYNDNKFNFNIYSTFKMLYIPTGIAFTLAITVVYIIVSLFVGKKYRKFKYFSEFLSAIAVMWVISLISTVIQSGNCDITMNSYTFNAIFDIMLVCAVIGGVRIMLKMRDDKKEQFGITKE